jgi:hypothetical protein
MSTADVVVSATPGTPRGAILRALERIAQEIQRHADPNTARDRPRRSTDGEIARAFQRAKKAQHTAAIG